MIGLFAVTAAGHRAAADLGARLGPNAVLADGPLGPAVRRIWPELDSAVFFLAADATVRLVAPLLRDKHTDPGVVCVDADGRFAIALAGGDSGGANALAEQVADVLGALPVVAPEGTGSTLLDEVADLLDATVDGDLGACASAVLDGEPVRLVNPHGFALPALPENVAADLENPVWTVVIDDRRPENPEEERTLRLVPRTLVVGVGATRGVPRTAVTELLARLDREHRLDPRAVRAFATIDPKADEDGIREAIQDIGFWHSAEGGDELPLLHYPSATLAEVAVAEPSELVHAETGTAGVAEAAALHAARELGSGASAEPAAGKLKGAQATVAAARILPRGRLAIIGLGPDAADLRTPRSEAELRRAAVVLGSGEFLEQVGHLLRSGTDVRTGELGTADARAEEAVALARSGKAVALIGSGDAVLDAMASTALEKGHGDVEYVDVPAVSWAREAAALLGAPLGHDHARITLSESSTPWEITERRLRAGAEGDLVVCLENPSLAHPRWARALRILAEHRPASTPVGAVRRTSRGRRAWCAPISEFDPAEVDEYTTVVVGSSRSTMAGDRMVAGA